MKKIMTIDTLAILMQREFLEFKKEMSALRKEMKAGFAALTRKKVRVDRVEKKLGIS
jgi:hypothetical protein